MMLAIVRSHKRAMLHALLMSIAISRLLGGTHAQTGPDSPLGGPVYPPPINVLKCSAVSRAVDTLKQTLDAAVGNGTIADPNASFHISVFSADDVVFGYNHAALGQNDSLKSGILDRNTIFRIGSISKLLSVYTLLAATGMSYINDPVTKWVPELAATPVPDDGDVNTVRWKDVTIGALASHMAGVLKDFSLDDITRWYNSSTLEDIGLPRLPSSDVITCGSDPKLSACRRDESFSKIQSLHPVTSAFNMPIYSNEAFQILAYALEGITNKTFAQVFEESLVRPLNLTRTSATPLEATEGLNLIIPENEIDSWWKVDAGGDAASSAEGWVFSTGADLTSIGQSILSSSLLPPAVTRRWMKPTADTPDLRFSVGMPWEIQRIEVHTIRSFDQNSSSSSTHITDLYTNGGGGDYIAQFALSPDQGFGFAVLVVGPAPPAGQPDGKFSSMQTVNQLITEAFSPAFEAAALEQAARNFAGHYVVSGDNGEEAMALTIIVGDGRLGLGVQNWTAGNDKQDLLVNYFATLNLLLPVNASLTGQPSLRLYPVGLRSNGQVAFRGVWGPLTNQSVFSAPGQGPFTRACAAWGEVGEPPYGNIGLDDFIFDVDETGKATAIIARGVRTTLSRKQIYRLL